MKVSVKSDKLAEILLFNGMNTTELASKVNVSISYMSLVVNGKRHPSPKLAKKMSDVLKVKIADIFYIKDTDQSKEVKQ